MMLASTRNKDYTCSECDKSFTHQALVHNHMHQCHSLKDVRNVNFEEQINILIQKYMKIDITEKPHECQYCNKKFTYECYLIEHTRTHTGEKPHQCDYCGLRFTAITNLYRHTRIHTRDKPYKCLICDSRFAHSYSLKRHAWIHTAKKLYQCTHCERRFTRKYVLNRHIRRYPSHGTEQ